MKTAARLPSSRLGRIQVGGSGAAWHLLRFLLGLAVLFGLYGLFLWQASTITTIQQATAELRHEISDAEQENVALMLQVAAWNRPDYIEGKATALGMVQTPQSAFVQAPAAGARQAIARQADLLGDWWQETTAQVISRLRALIPSQVMDLLRLLGLA